MICGGGVQSRRMVDVQRILQESVRSPLILSRDDALLASQSTAQGQTEKLRWQAQIGSLGPDTQ
jgi:hypothetical protein